MKCRSIKYSLFISILYLSLSAVNLQAKATEWEGETHLSPSPANDLSVEIESPDEIAEALELAPTEFLQPNPSFNPLSVDEWSDKNGVDLTQLFRVVIFVNKATSGPTAQTAKVYFEGLPFKEYTISTGREKLEKSPSGKVYYSTTPLGWFRPQVFSPKHYSKTWLSPMPWAVFFNGGIALHATTPSHYGELGRRASGGCVRFRHDEAKEVYQLIKGAGTSLVPEFTEEGLLVRDENQQIVMKTNYDTLIIVADEASL